MRKLLAATAIAAMLFAACGGDDQAATTPAPTGTHEITGRIMGPAGDAQDTVDKLNDLQEQQERDTGAEDPAYP
jgi:ABC-type glycerol-3-phosphate transport system substrate-binding protein